jgi:DNA-binding winged helix-turn-helix (wHTH) protein
LRDEVLLRTAASQEVASLLDDAQSATTPHLRFVRLARRLVVDIVLPYGRLHPDATEAETTEQQTFPTGYLRLGIDAGDFAAAAGCARRLAALAGAGAWIAGCALAWVLLRRRPVGVSESPEPIPSAALRTVAAGQLTLDMDTGCLDVASRAVQLTPKQRDLVALLLSEPGRPFPDSEILARVWANSRYANSRDVKQYVYLTRQRLAVAGLPADEILANEPGLGYRIVLDAVPAAVDPAIDPPSVDEAASEDEGCPQRKERSNQ